MTSTTFFIIFIPILSVILLLVNLILAPHNPYQEKDSVFECGFHSFLGQNRTQFSVSFFIFGLLFLLFDLEILLVYPYSVSGYTNDVYGLIIMMIFFVLLTLGFIFELGKNALSIDSKQTSSYNSEDTPKSYAFLSKSHISIFFVILFLFIGLIITSTLIDLFDFSLIYSFDFSVISCDGPDFSSLVDGMNIGEGDSFGEPEDPVPGRRCPSCLERGDTVWVIPGKCCPQCGTPVN